jgi:hypothetical protein
MNRIISVALTTLPYYLEMYVILGVIFNHYLMATDTTNMYKDSNVLHKVGCYITGVIIWFPATIKVLF